MRTKLAALAVVVSSTALFGGSTSAGAAGSTQDRLVNRDSREYARAYDVALAEAERRLSYQRPAGALDARLSSTEAASFGGLWIEHAPAYRVVVGVTDLTAAPRVRAMAGAVNDVLDVRLVPRTVAALDGATAAVVATVERAGVEAASQTEYPHSRGVVYVVDVAQAERVLAAAGHGLPDFVTLRQVPSMPVNEADVYGGLAITTCTSGYSVRNSTGTTGILTAGHCGNTQSWNSTNLPYQSGQDSGSTDAQWHTTPGHTTRPWVFDDLNEPTENDYRSMRTVIHRDAQPVGGWACKYGKTTFYKCGSITSKTFDPGPSHNATFIRVERDGDNLSEGGDSGGPWFNGTDAYGTHTGAPTDDANDSVYAPLNYAQTSLSITVDTQPVRNVGNTLWNGDVMYGNDYMTSPNGVYKVYMQNDGNFVLYKSGVAKWATSTNSNDNAGGVVRMQVDGNLVVYRPGNVAVWSSSTFHSNSRLVIQNDCNLVIYNGWGSAVWASNTYNC